MSVWTTPITWANGALTAAQMNSLRDNLNWLKGALAQAGVTVDTAAPELLQVVTGAGLLNVGSISIPTGVSTVLTFDTETYDSDAFHDPTTNPGRITVPAGLAGRYQFGAQCQWQGNATGYRQLFIRLNGVTIVAAAQSTPSSTEAVYQNMTSPPISLAAADYLEILAVQNSGAALSVIGTASLSPSFWARRVGL